MEGLDELEEPRRGRGGLAVFGWAVFAVLFGVAALFGYKVWHYAGQIRRGELVDLPQFSQNLTRTGRPSQETSTVLANRAQVEKDDNPALGADVPQITIVEFADFECPFSKQEATAVRRLAAKYGSKVKFVYRDYPLTTIHPHAYQAALAGECAREQGKFWQFHDKLYLNADSLTIPSMTRMAQEAGLDPAQFERCVTDARYRDKVEADIADATALGIPGTPTFYINGQKVEGAIPEDVFDQLISRFVK
jgi:protein-disulfide isomerase